MMSGGAEVEPNSGVAAAIEGAAKASATSTANTPILTDMRQIYTNSGVALTFARGGGTPESRDPVLARPWLRPQPPRRYGIRRGGRSR